MNTLQAGITAAQEGRRADAQALLKQALLDDPSTEQGWLWMSAVVDTDAERRTCLERVLTINPHNQTAQAGLEKLNAGQNGGNGSAGYLPISQSVQAGGQGYGQASAPSPHSMPTQGVAPVAASPRPIRRLAPQAEPEDGLAALRAAQYQTPPSSADSSSSQSDPFMAVVLIGGLSLTALTGLLMLGVLLIIGWPP
jgi:hypothetical protein